MSHGKEQKCKTEVIRFNEAIRVLRERHLVERDETPSGVNLRTHRALQRTILHRLDSDPESRQLIFNDVAILVRKAFPIINLAKRGDLGTALISEKYLPQIISLNTAFAQSHPKMGNNFNFAWFLQDAGYYLLNKGIEVDGIPILETSVEVGTAMIPTDPTKVRPIVADALSSLQLYKQYFGIPGRQEAQRLTTTELELLDEQMAGIPKDHWTDYDKIAMIRALVDLGVTSVQLSHMDEGAAALERALEQYDDLQDQAPVLARLALIKCCKLWPSASEQKDRDTRKLASEACELMAQELGNDAPLTQTVKFVAASAMFTIGDIDEALRRHKEVYDAFQHDRGSSAHETLASQYNLAVCYQNVGHLEQAEHHLRENIKNSCVNLQWREEDIGRSKFRLSLVLRATNRPIEAETMRTEALKTREAWATALPDLRTEKEYTDKDDMAMFDFSVTLWHGRTTGIWSDGTRW